MWFVDLVYKGDETRIGVDDLVKALSVRRSVDDWSPTPTNIKVFEGGTADEFGSGRLHMSA